MTEENESQRTTTAVRRRVRELVRELAPNPVKHAGADTRLEEDLHYDSLALVNLAVCLEREFELVGFAESQGMDIALETVGDVEAVVDGLVRGSAT